MSVSGAQEMTLGACEVVRTARAISHAGCRDSSRIERIIPIYARSKFVGRRSFIHRGPAGPYLARRMRPPWSCSDNWLHVRIASAIPIN